MPAPWRPGLGDHPVRPLRARASRGRSPPGSSCAARSSGWPRRATRSRSGAEAEYFLVRRTRRRRDRGGRSPGPGQGTLLRRPGPDPDVRPPDHGVAPHEQPRLGQLRQRPRGRQRAVRAELPLRRPPDHGRPGDRVPLHGPLAGGRGRDARHLHAQALHPPDGERAAHAPQPVGRAGRRSCSPTRTTAEASACRRSGTPSSPACSSTPRP